MSVGLQKRLYEMEVDPPAEVWNRLSAVLDEINSDNKLSEKIYGAAATPGYNSWEKIKNVLDEDAASSVTKTRIFNFRRLAVAAIFIGIIVSAYFLFFNKQNESTGITTVEPPVKKAESVVTGNNENKVAPPTSINLTPIATTDKQQKLNPAVKPGSVKIQTTNPSLNKVNEDGPVLLASIGDEVQNKDHLGDKIFKEPIDDLSMVASNSNYVSIVSADGRLVKIPSHLAGLAPYLQQKPGESDYLDILFEESVYWKDKFKEWREKLAQSPVTPSFDNFFDIIGLLKTIQEN